MPTNIILSGGIAGGIGTLSILPVYIGNCKNITKSAIIKAGEKR